MTELTISVPGDVAEFLQAQEDMSAYVTAVVRREMPDARRTDLRPTSAGAGPRS